MLIASDTSIHTLASIDMQTLRTCFNESFKQYYVPLQLCPFQFAEKLQAEAIDLNLSFGIFIEDKLAGFILNGIDIVDNKKCAYNAGTGILPQYRGDRLSYLLYEHCIERLRKAGVTRIVLEVIEQNAAAIKTYERLGFTVTRKLNSYKGRPPLVLPRPVKTETIPFLLWDLLQVKCEWKPSWQFNMRSIKRLQNKYTLQVAFCNDKWVAYCISNLNTGRIAHFGCDEINNKQRYLTALFKEVNDANRLNTLSIVNVDSNAFYSNTFLLSLGMQRFITSSEMEMRLS